MASQIIDVKIRERYDTEANWSTHNPMLMIGEIAFSSDKNGQFKVGDGTKNWKQLSYNQISWSSIIGRPSTLNPSLTTLSNQDLNTVLTPGFYNAGGGNTVTNKPANIDAFGLLVYKTAGGYVTQELTEGNTNASKKWIRQYNGSTWSAWSHFYSVLYPQTDGSVLSNINASRISTGTLSAARLPTVVRTNSTSNGTLGFAGSFPVLDSITTDTYGRVTAVNTKTFALPANPNTDTKSTQTNTTGNADYRMILSYNANDATETYGVRKSTNFLANPNTGEFYAKGYRRINITGQTLDINTLNLSAGAPTIARYIEKTSGGSANITNIPVVGQPFILDVELIRWATSTDYITMQTFRNGANQSNEYVRYCVSGTWNNWATRVFTDTKNTTGSTNSSSKLFIVGATSQAANPVTYSHDTAYVGTDGCLYSNNTKVSVEGHGHSALKINGTSYTGLSATDIDLLPFITGTQTAITGAWTGNAVSITALFDGLSIRYWLPYNGSGNATLNLTLAGGDTTGAVACYWKGTSRLTTHYSAGSVITLTYRKNVSISGSGSYTGWWADADYNSDTMNRLRFDTAIKAKAAIVSGRIITGNVSGYSQLAANTAFDITYPILYSASSISSGSTGTNNYSAYPGIAIKNTYSFTITAYSMVYIKGKLSGTTFTPNSTVLTCTKPTSPDGFTYLQLGYAFSTSGIYLLSEHPMFQFRNGQFQQVYGDMIEFDELKYGKGIDGGNLDDDTPVLNTYDGGTL